MPRIAPTKPGVRDSGRKPSQEQAKPGATKISAAASYSLPNEESAKAIARLLRHTYLRTRSRTHAFHFLYGPVPEKWKQIDFKLEGEEGEIEEADFKVGHKRATWRTRSS
jgi:hypothetical protein